MDIQENIKQIKKLETSTCAASIILGGGIGFACYSWLGAISGGLGGGVVAIFWCVYMRGVFARVTAKFGSLFIAGAALGALAGAADGAFMHFTSLSLYYSRFNSDLPASLMIMAGVITGAIAGAFNGGLWGACYSFVACSSRNKTLENLCA